jgi:hypothetical protein
MEDNKWPSWFYGPDNASKICESEAEVPAGWVDHPSKVGSTKPKAESAANKTAAPTAEKFGKNPSPRLTLEAINEKLAENQPQYDL